MKIWNKYICLTSRKSLLVLATLLISTLMLAAVWSEKESIKIIETVEPPEETTNEVEIWVPTKEDIEYQDSMYQIILNTQNDVDTIKVQVQQIIKRLDDVQ